MLAWYKEDESHGEVVLLLNGEVTVPLRKLWCGGNSGRTTKFDVGAVLLPLEADPTPPFLRSDTSTPTPFLSGKITTPEHFTTCHGVTFTRH